MGAADALRAPPQARCSHRHAIAPQPCTPAPCNPPLQVVKQQQSGIQPAAASAALPGGALPAGRLTRSQARALKSGASLSSLLQARSEACTTSRPSSLPAEPASPLPDIDGPDRGNPLAACDYVNDLYRFYRRVEPEFRVPHDYMAHQVRRRACRISVSSDLPPTWRRRRALLPRRQRSAKLEHVVAANHCLHATVQS